MNNPMITNDSAWQGPRDGHVRVAITAFLYVKRVYLEGFTDRFQLAQARAGPFLYKKNWPIFLHFCIFCDFFSTKNNNAFLYCFAIANKDRPRIVEAETSRRWWSSASRREFQESRRHPPKRTESFTLYPSDTFSEYPCENVVFKKNKSEREKNTSTSCTTTVFLK